MNATVHSELSVRHYKGQISDYYPIHDFMDCTKELESSNLHRAISHNLWFVKQVIIPIFGHTIVNSDKINVNVKDLAEMDHILPDFNQKFLPSLADYISLVSDDPNDAQLFKEFDGDNSSFYKKYPQVRELMLSPLHNTGFLKSLLVTHNSWFINFILPKIFKDIDIQIKDFNIAPANLFNRMKWAEWVNNGKFGFPPSAAKIVDSRKSKLEKINKVPAPRDIVCDGSGPQKFDKPDFDFGAKIID
jgi:hypothetical protein